MKTLEIKLSFEEQIYNKLVAISEAYKKNINDIIKASIVKGIEKTIEELEDEADLKIIQEAMKKPHKTYTLDEVIEHLDIKL